MYILLHNDVYQVQKWLKAWDKARNTVGYLASDLEKQSNFLWVHIWFAFWAKITGIYLKLFGKGEAEEYMTL